MKIANMRENKRGHQMVAFGNGIFAASGWNNGWDGKDSSEWFDGKSWSFRANHLDVGSSCLTVDHEAGLIYMLGGYKQS